MHEIVVEILGSEGKLPRKVGGSFLDFAKYCYYRQVVEGRAAVCGRKVNRRDASIGFRDTEVSRCLCDSTGCYQICVKVNEQPYLFAQLLQMFKEGKLEEIT